MSEAFELWERPEAKKIYMIAGWQQWADAGSVSSGLPEYLIQQTKARHIGNLHPHGYYLFQFPGTHDLVRPVVKYEKGYPVSLQTPHNELYYAGNNQSGVIFFLGDEPHMDVERYTAAFLDAAQILKVQRIVGLGGVYAELPYDKERMITATYSLPKLKAEMEALAVSFSDYHGGASIGSYICRRSGEKGLEYVSFYALVPTYDLSNEPQIGSAIRIENDFMAWLNVMRRINYMLKINIDLSDLEEKSRYLIKLVDEKFDELDRLAPQFGVRDYLKRLSDEFTEMPFNPLEDIWEEELKRIINKFDTDQPA